ncbi:chorismate--pyruvate lyase family protein [Celerinatantimonas sp. YJH-8]|uniref:chorismate--pyruvate lyase family protein n=1 Tax=Celerinatantimonas sp. YJH-8 TaxID=3228714 RepID=UPI0038C752B7
MESLSWPEAWDSWAILEPDKLPEAMIGNWLRARGSLTQQLKRYCQRFRVDVLLNQPAIARQDEMTLLNGHSRIWERQVCLSGDGIPWVLARSLWDPKDGSLRALSRINTQPLGEWIFSNQDSDPLQLRQISRCYGVHPEPLWARRSVYSVRASQLLVQELFLPDCPAYLEICHGQ